MLVHHFLQLSAERAPDTNAAWYEGLWTTFSEIELLSNRLGNHLWESGIRHGDRVALFYENSIDWIVSYYAILKIGAIVVPINTDSTSNSLAFLLNDSGAKTIVASRMRSRILLGALQNCSDLKEIIVSQENLGPYEGIASCNVTRLCDVFETAKVGTPPGRCIDIDPASIIYTSGSTGKPKGVTLSHVNITTNAQSIAQYLDLRRMDRVISVLPFSYVYGKSLLDTQFLVGGSIVVDNRFLYPQVILESMVTNQVTGFAGVPSTFMILLNKSTVRDFKFPDLRFVTQAGGAMPPNIQREVKQVFAPARLFIMYGATEAGPRLTYLHPDQFESKCGSIGKAIPNVEVYIADDEGRPVPQGEIGEIVARGSNIMLGYWNDPESTCDVLRNGLYFTGDLGREDEEGFLYVVGRTKEIIKAGGFRVSAKEIEEAIYALEGVEEVAVIAVEDPSLGEAIKAFVVPRTAGSLDEKGLRNSLKLVLPVFKQPTYIEIRSSLPKNQSGKILKSTLKDEEAAKGTNPQL